MSAATVSTGGTVSTWKASESAGAVGAAAFPASSLTL